MNKKTLKITFCAVLAAFSVVFMYIGTVFPTGRMGFMAIASLFSVAAMAQYGYGAALGVFAVSGVLGFLLVPDKMPLVFYALFFGYYPIVKNMAECLKKPVLSWAVKLAVFNAALTAVYLLFKELLMFRFFETLSGAALTAAVYVVFNIVFVVYDIGLSRLIRFYMIRIHNRLK